MAATDGWRWQEREEEEEEEGEEEWEAWNKEEERIVEKIEKKVGVRGGFETAKKVNRVLGGKGEEGKRTVD